MKQKPMNKLTKLRISAVNGFIKDMEAKHPDIYLPFNRAQRILKDTAMARVNANNKREYRA